MNMQESVNFFNTFDTPVFYSFGSSIPVINFAGFCLDGAETKDKKHNWLSQWIRLYSEIKSTRLIDHGARMHVDFEGYKVQGWLISMNFSKNSQIQELANIGFSMVVKEFSVPGIGGSKGSRRVDLFNKQMPPGTTGIKKVKNNTKKVEKKADGAFGGLDASGRVTETISSHEDNGVLT